MGTLDQATTGLTDLNTSVQTLTKTLAQLIQTVSSIFPRVNGTFTLSAAATTTVTQTSITASSIIVLMPTNAAAGTLVGSVKSPYISARTVGASFAVSTANAAAAAGTETFSYFVVNPS